MQLHCLTSRSLFLVLFASVATGFPAGQTPLKTRLEEVQMAVEDGATEIDIVINRTLALTGQWTGVCNQHAKGFRYQKTLLNKPVALGLHWFLSDWAPDIGLNHQHGFP